MKTPPHPHLIPAIRRWLLETFDVVHLHIRGSALNDATLQKFVREDGLLVLSVTPSDVTRFTVSSDTVTFSTRFSGRSHSVNIPAVAVLGLAAFNSVDNDQQIFYPLPTWTGTTTPTPPTLSIVK